MSMLSIILAFGVIAQTSVSDSGPASSVLTREQARLLALEAAKESGLTKYPGFSMETADMSRFPFFYFFDGVVGGTKSEGYSGHYAVNKVTGEVWNPFGCTLFNSPRLSSLFRKISKSQSMNTEMIKGDPKQRPCLSN